MSKIKIISILNVVIFVLLAFTQCSKDDVKSDRCSLEPNVGPCNAAIPKYYYDKNDKKCKQFIWGGCDGVVPFDTIEECKNQCDCK